MVASRPADTPMFELNREVVRSFVRQTGTESSLPIVVYFPSDRNFRALAKDRRRRSLAQTMLDGGRIPYTDMTACLPPAERSPADGRNHCAPAGNAAVAACLRDRGRALLLQPSAPAVPVSRP